MSRLLLVAACLTLLLGIPLLGSGAAHAQESGELRILLLEGPTQDWVRRVRGQLSDLPVAISTLAVSVEGQPEPALSRQLAPLAEHRDAAFVAWLETDGGQPRATARGPGALADAGRTEVAIWFARSGRFFTRRLGRRWSELSAADRSGALELAALSVRSAVRSLLLDPTQSQPFSGAESAASAAAPSSASGGAAAAGASSIGSPTAATTPAAAATTPAAAASSTPAAAAERSAESPNGASVAAGVGAPPATLAEASAPEVGPIVVPPGAALAPTDLPSADRSPSEPSAAGVALDLRWNAELGFVGQAPGPPGYAAVGVSGGLRVRSGAWGLLALGQLGLPLRSELGPTKLELQQHALLAQLEYLGWARGAWSFGPLLRGGVRFARRETLAGEPALDAAAVAWHQALRLGLGATTEFRWGTRFGLGLRGVLHWDPSRPTYSVRTTSGAVVSRAEPWAVQPSLEISGNWYW